MMHSLPSLPTTFIGRHIELVELTQMLTETSCRLLSLVGPGGIGKTRLAIEVAARNQDAFADGVAFVALQPAHAPDTLAATLAEALGLPLADLTEPRTQLINHLRPKHLLLVLDNMEHLLEGVDLLSAMLAAAPGVTLFVTSREALNLQEEWRYPLNGLEVPPALSPADLERYSAVRLFVERARQVRRDFGLDSELDAVVRICQLVAGTPLALELAATWTATLPCTDIAAGIASTLSFLESRLRNIPPRHRSMRATFEQSWRLLNDDERCLFRRLSVFRGGFTRAAAEVIVLEAAGTQVGACYSTAGPPCPTHCSTHDILSALVDKSLVQFATQGRYQIHELLRQFAEAHLCESSEEAAWVYEQHTRFVLDLAERAEQELRGPNQHAWLEQLAIEHDNVRAVLHRAQANNDLTTVLRLGGALWRFWWIRGHLREGRVWLEQALGCPPPTTQNEGRGEVLDGEQRGAELARQMAVRTKALNGAGNLACAQGDYTTAWALHQECLALRRECGDQRGIAVSLHNLGLIARDRGDYPTARALFEESLAIKRALGDRRGVSASLDDLGSVLQHQGDFVAACALHEESLAIKHALGDQQALVAALINLGLVAQRQGDYAAAYARYQHGLSIAQQIGDRQNTAEVLAYVGFTHVLQGQYGQAHQVLRESVILYREIGSRSEVLKPLEGFACVAGALGYAECSAQLFGATEALRLQHSAVRPPVDDAVLVQYIEAVREQLGTAQCAAAWAKGRTLSLEQAVGIALEDLPALLAVDRQVATPAPPTLPSPPSLIENLSARELQVLHLIADGQSNQEIAARLVISEGTVKWYTGQIYGKLGVRRRTQAVARARELQLVA